MTIKISISILGLMMFGMGSYLLYDSQAAARNGTEYQGIVVGSWCTGGKNQSCEYSVLINKINREYKEEFKVPFNIQLLAPNTGSKVDVIYYEGSFFLNHVYNLWLLPAFLMVLGLSFIFGGIRYGERLYQP